MWPHSVVELNKSNCQSQKKYDSTFGWIFLCATSISPCETIDEQFSLLTCIMWYALSEAKRISLASLSNWHVNVMRRIAAILVVVFGLAKYTIYVFYLLHQCFLITCFMSNFNTRLGNLICKILFVCMALPLLYINGYIYYEEDVFYHAKDKVFSHGVKFLLTIQLKRILYLYVTTGWCGNLWK